MESVIVTKHEEVIASLMDKILVRESLLSLFGAIIHKFHIKTQQYTVNTFKHNYTQNNMQQQLMRRWEP